MRQSQEIDELAEVEEGFEVLSAFLFRAVVED